MEALTNLTAQRTSERYAKREDNIVTVIALELQLER